MNRSGAAGSDPAQQAAIDLTRWSRTGVALVEDFLVGDDLAVLRGWIDEVESSPATPGGYLHYDERVGAETSIRCRTENFVPFHPGLRKLLTEGPLLAMATALLGEEAILYKEKINYKNAGGAGFAAHQDAPAYPFVQATITCMVAIDDTTVDNGCLDVVPGAHQSPLPTDDHGCIRRDIAESLPWEPVPTRSGSLLWFDWYTPHRSGTNRTTRPRRALYLTYNRASDGNRRDTYYAEKTRRLARNAERISLIGHFQGQSRAVADRAVHE